MATKTEERTTVGAWVPLFVARELRSRAAAADRSVSAEVRRALARHLKTANGSGPMADWEIQISDEREPGEALAAGTTNATQAAPKSCGPIKVTTYTC